MTTLASYRAHARRFLAVGAVLLAGMAVMSTISHAAAPVQLVSARTADNGDGYLDTIEVTFSTVMDSDSTPAVSDGIEPGFFVEGYEIASFSWDNATTLLIHLVQKMAGDTGETPMVVYVPGDGVATPLGLEPEPKTFDAAIDNAGPVLMTAEASDHLNANLFEANSADRLYLTFSEPATLSGAAKLDRWANLETVMQLTAHPAGCQDGTGVGAVYNFPQPKGDASDDDPILSPAPPSDGAVDFQSTFTIALRSGNVAVGNGFRIPGAGTLCSLGISSGPGATSKIVDQVGNQVVTQAAIPARRVYVTPVDAEVLIAETVDGRTGSPDGKVDAVQLVFDQKLIDSTVDLTALTLTVNGQPATIDTSSLDSGATPNDEEIFVRFTQSAAWGTSAVANIAYTKPATCTATGGTGIKATVPTPGFQACMASFDKTATDGAGPALLSAVTVDANGDGTLDGVRARFSESVASVRTNGWQVGGVSVNAAAVDITDRTYVDFAIVPASLPNSDATPVLSYSAPGGGNATTDGVNEVPASSVTTADGAAPRVVGATAFDSDENGAIDRVVLEYSESLIDPASSVASQFSFGGAPAMGFAAANENDNDPDAADDRFLTLAFSSATGTDAQDLAFATGAQQIRDAATNASGAQTFAKASVTDMAKPVGTVHISPTAPMKAGTSDITVSFSEPMATDAPTVTFGSATISKTVTPTAADHTNGWDDTNRAAWHGSVAIVGEPAGGDCAVSTGCEVTVTFTGAQDLATTPNQQAAPATKVTEIDTIAPAAPVLTGVSITEAAGESAPANVVNMFTTAIGATATMTPADAEDGRAEILVDGTAITADDSSIGSTDASVAPDRTFADLAALKGAFGEAGATHAVTVNLCDDANNCTPSGNSISVTSDFDAVGVSLTSPTGDDLVKGGQEVDVVWDGGDGADFDHVELDYSTDDGATYTGVIDHAQAERDDTFTWTVPSVNIAQARIRVAAVDSNGNKGYGSSAVPFSIDSSAPVVKITAPSVSNPFVPAGGDTTITWTVTDASVDRVTDPMTIEYSSNGGSTWSAINGGSYSKEDDGSEVWHVPSGASFTTLVRVKAIDAAGFSTTVVSTKLARGVEGFTVERGGRVYAFGTASNSTSEGLVSSSDLVRGIAVRSDNKTGYVVIRDGRIYPFASGGAARPATPSGPRFSSDRARGIVLRTSSTGYVLASDGRLYSFGGAPSAKVSKTFTCDCARGVVMLLTGRGGYVLDKYGRLYPFAVGSYSRPASIQASTLSSSGYARSVALRTNQRSGWILMQDGSIRGFGGAVSPTSWGKSSSANAKSLILVTQDGGYWMDGRGHLNRWGTAIGDPTKQTFSSGTARGAGN